MALTEPEVLLPLLARFGSVVPDGGVTEALFTIEPVALALTVPVIVMVTLEEAGKLGTAPLTLLPATVTLAGQAAPLVAPPHVALMEVMLLGRRSLKLVPLAGLGPALLTTKL